MRLENFLAKIFSLSDGSCKPVWIYEYDHNGVFYPDRARGYDGLLAVYKSNYNPSVTMSGLFLNKEVAEIYWTEEGIAVTVI